MPTTTVKVSLAQLQDEALISLLTALVERAVGQRISIVEEAALGGLNGYPLLAAKPVKIDADGNLDFSVEYEEA